MTTLPPRAARKSGHQVSLRHPEMGHLIERLAVDYHLCFPGCCQPGREMIAEHSFYTIRESQGVNSSTSTP